MLILLTALMNTTILYTKKLFRFNILDILYIQYNKTYPWVPIGNISGGKIKSYNVH